MTLEQTINEDIKKAMLAKDEVGLRSLRAIKAAILLAKTAEGAKDTLSAEDEIKLVQKLVKQRKDSLEIFEKQHRPDLAKKEKEEIEVMEKYL
ncbi:MAG TPA: GatB/YqeY domain-containing protein, partial [Niabella sp.]